MFTYKAKYLSQIAINQPIYKRLAVAYGKGVNELCKKNCMECHALW